MSAFTPPWIDEDLALFQAHVARFVARELAPLAGQWEADRQVDRNSWAKAASAGLICPSVPEEYGGGGGSLAHEAIVQQELMRAGLGGSFGICLSIQSTIVAHYVLEYGTEDQKKRWLPKMATAEMVTAIAMTEPGAGSDLQAIRTRAVSVDGGYRISGQKTFISNGQNADLVLVVARTGEGGGKALSLFGVEAAAPGFHRGRKLEKLGLHGQDTSELFFDEVFVPSENLLGGVPNAGFVQLMSQLAWERMVVALNAVVAMERALDLTVAYVRERKAFGAPLISLQNTQFVLAEAKAQTVVGRQLVDSFMVLLLAGTLDATQAALAKLWATETAFKTIDACQQLFGGYGYMIEYPIARLFADARAARVYGGSSEIMKLIIARSL